MGVRPRLRVLAGVAAVFVLRPPRAGAICRLPFHFPEGAKPSGATVGPHNSLVIASDSGTLLFADLDDYAIREDSALNDKYKDSYGWFDLEGVAMTSPESTYLYVGLENEAAILEYEWHSSRRVTRRFNLPGFERSAGQGLQSVTWVPTDASTHLGYFYVGSGLKGNVFIYELPLLDDTGPEATARLISIWTPLEGNKLITGLSYSGGYVFTSYDDGNSNRVQIYPKLASGRPGELAEQYEVDITNAEGMAVRQTDQETWEVFFASDARQELFVYSFRFVRGFEPHPHCSARGLASPTGGAPRLAPAPPPWSVSALLWSLSLAAAGLPWHGR